MLGWQKGRAGQAYFVTDQHRVWLRPFLERQFALYGVTDPLPEIDVATAEAVVPVPARWFVRQSCTLRTDKAVAELGYAPVVDQEAGVAAVRDSLDRS